DESGQPTETIVERRRSASFVSPIPKARGVHADEPNRQGTLGLDEGHGLSSAEQQYELTATLINDVRRRVDEWRQIPDPGKWRVTPDTARLLQHWRSAANYQNYRPFFCQVEAAETVIWLTEVAPQAGVEAERILGRLKRASLDTNRDLQRVALKLATGAGKTTVMAMLIAWQTVNAVRHPNSPRFTKGFLVITPGITIKDRLRVLQPNDPESYYTTRGLVPDDMRADVLKAKVVITNYHAFMLRERLDISRGGRDLLQGRTAAEAISSTETEGQMLQRVMPELMGMRNVLVINDEAHHCYREKPADDSPALKGEEKKEAEENNAAARVWITGIETVQRKLGVQRVLDLSATPFFLAGSGYAEGTLFPCTACDFSLMDAIECGIVKLPRVPVADNISMDEMPMYRDLWKHIGKQMPKKGRGPGKVADPQDLPAPLLTALHALYDHYAKTFEVWRAAKIGVPPCFIVVCNNTATSQLVYNYIAGYWREEPDGSVSQVNGRLELFRNHDGYGNPLPRPNTLLIDSKQLESGEALDPQFKQAAEAELELFRRARIERGGDPNAEPSDAEILREVMNTVGKVGQLGEQVRCVVSVSMLTEGWDANTVTHVLGVRAFGTQLLCEQVVGRALRRQSYEAGADGLFEPEYADVLGVPFDFTAKPVVAPARPPRELVIVRAVSPERDHLAIEFPRVQGYRIELPEDRFEVSFTPDSRMVLTPEDVGATLTLNSGIIGATQLLGVIDGTKVRNSQLEFELTGHLMTYWRDKEGRPITPAFHRLRPVVRRWLDECLECVGHTRRQQLMYRSLANQACEKILHAITRAEAGTRQPVAILDPFNPTGSTRHVHFATTKAERWQADERKSHVNWVVLDSGWEQQFCLAAEQHPKVIAYVKNQGLGLEVPYVHQGHKRTYFPDFVVLADDGRGAGDPLHLIVEVKGQPNAESAAKKETMENHWVPGVNRLGEYGRWKFVQFENQWQMADELTRAIG
ncbi:MAG: DEAD/DEAH box helicase family protein, partial [Trueperaceae bacterium]|nr:DEAD/DEAH box helicase family protein [Trueperaceae bacterium]